MLTLRRQRICILKADSCRYDGESGENRLMDDRKVEQVLKEVLNKYGGKVDQNRSEFKSAALALLNEDNYLHERTVLRNAMDVDEFWILLETGQITAEGIKTTVERIQEETRMAKDDAECVVRCIVAAKGGNPNIVKKKLPWPKIGIGAGVLAAVGLLLVIVTETRNAAYEDTMRQLEAAMQNNLETAQKEPVAEKHGIDMTDEYSYSGNAAANLRYYGSLGYDGILAKMTGEETVYYYADLSGNLYRKSLGDDAWELIYQGTIAGNHINDINVDNIGGKYVYFEYGDGSRGANRICRLNAATLEMEEIAYGYEPRLMCGKLYYLRPEGNKDSICCMDPETLMEEILFEPMEDKYYIYDFSVTGEEIIFSANGSIIKLTPQGEWSTIYNIADASWYEMIICGKYIFLQDHSTRSEFLDPVRKLDFNGNIVATYETNEEALTTLYSVQGEDLYLSSVYSNELLRMRMDSGEMEVILNYPDGIKMVLTNINIVDETMLLKFFTIAEGGNLVDLYALPVKSTDMNLEDCVHLYQGFIPK